MAVVITELPYQVNKTTLIEKMADLVASKKITDVRDIRDESDRDGMRIVVEVKRDGSPHTVMQQLFKHTPLQTSFSANMLALVDGQPQTLGLKKMLEHYITYRREVVRRRTEFDLARAQERAHILEGLKIALDNLDEVIATIRAAADVDAARSALMKRFELTEVQANAILEMQLRRLAALERKKIEDEYKAIIQLISELEDLLANPRKILLVIKDELDGPRQALRRRAQDPHPGRCEPRAHRRGPRAWPRTWSSRSASAATSSASRSAPSAPSAAAAAASSPCSPARRTPSATCWWRTRTTTSSSSRTADASSSPRSTRCPMPRRQAKGLPIINLPGVQVEQREYVSAIISLPQFEPGHYLVMATRKRHDQEDLARGLRQDPRQRADRHQPHRRRRAPVGRPVRRPERHHRRHQEGPGGPLHGGARSGRSAATRRA